MKQIAIYPSPVGNIQIEYANGAVIALKLAKSDTKADPPTAFSQLVCQQLDEYFAGTRTAFSLPLELHGTPFQEKVWAALQQIPYGEVRSYKDIATMIGNPKACRAVGVANNANPLFIIIPCHRVIGANGALVGYGGGLAMKKALLELEKQHKPEPAQK